MATFGTPGGTMENMKRCLPAAAVLAGVVVLGAGCGTTAAAPAGGHTGPAAAAALALPRPFTITARWSAKSLGLSHPASLAISPRGNLYVTDLSQRVTVISPAGTVLRRWGKPGSGPGEFRFVPSDPTVPTDVHASITVSPGDEVYVSDSGNGRVQVFTADGRFIRQFGSYGAGKGRFLLAYDLVVDQAGNVYVSDDQAETLTKFSPADKVLWQIGNGISTDPDLTGHFFVSSFDAHGRLVVMNDDQDKVLYIDPSGHKVDAFSPSTAGSPTGSECHATVDAAGNTYVAGCGTDTGPTLVYDRAHRLIAKWPGTPYALFRSPAFGPDGEVFALATDGSILKLHITLPGA
jgi:DNA-binding beta-propeller fold protein YncE